MKKKVLLLGLVWSCSLLFAGCTSRSVTSKESAIEETSESTSDLKENTMIELTKTIPNTLFTSMKNSEPCSFDFELLVLDSNNNLTVSDMENPKGTIAIDKDRIGKVEDYEFINSKEVNIGGIFYSANAETKTIGIKRKESLDKSTWNSSIYPVNLNIKDLYRGEEGVEVLSDGTSLNYISYYLSPNDVNEDMIHTRVYFNDQNELYGIADVVTDNNSKNLLIISNVTQEIPEYIFDMEGYTTNEDTIDLT